MKDKGTVLIALGLVLLLAAAALAGYNLLESRQAQQTATVLVQTLKEHLPQPARTEAPEEIPTQTPLYIQYPTMEMPVMPVDGQDYIGMVQIPCLELELPVIANWSYPALKTAPCRYQGSAYTGDLIIMAHNYDSHFGKLKDLRPEDVVIFTDTAGNEFRYRVVDLETLPGTAVEDMSAGEWDLTLFTCTYGGQSRVTIRCQQI